ncbi:ribose 5-phosphate isomerase A [Chitinophaga ginsengisoli]|uniref:Ribose 5-phosphate isomerase A n=1 Tax=Chitinophaga ginsengisoli TaxID=363837 RepID=A0A2P8GH77_9BACT|nr:ribose 5-phosphate isomerase A [Chitinophaga ginsengisoli]PSL33324.1 ribose-5-phosphate isomerase [Chitinophaga ginsengisoli]
MTDHKQEAAKAAVSIINAGQTIGLGGGKTIAYLAELLAENPQLMQSLTVTSSSFETSVLLHAQGFRLVAPSFISRLDIYFDGCDVFDGALNALKSGGGIHTMEKLLASAADRFVLLGDAGKFQAALNPAFPLAIEFLPQALTIVKRRIGELFPGTRFVQRMSSEKNGALISDNGNMLADIHFDTFPAPDQLNIQVKMIPGIVEHSLFYGMAHQAIISGADGVRHIYPV